MTKKLKIDTNLLEKIAAAVNQHTVNCYIKGAQSTTGRVDECMPSYIETMQRIYKILGQ